MPESATAARSKYATLRFEQHGHVGRLTLTRPEKLNSFTLEMWRELRELGEELLRDPRDLRALVVIGEGRAFSSGIDTSVFSEDRSATDLAAGDGAKRHDDPVVAGVLAAQDSYSWLEDAPFATIAAVRAYALGAGLQLALACDIRVMARGTKLGLLEFKYGIIPDLGGTQRLPRLVGAAKAKELIFTAAQIDADEAERIGLAEHVVADEELEEVADGLAGAIAAQPPLAVRAAKRAVNVAMSGASVRDGLVVEAEGQATCLRSDDMREAIAAFLEQRPAEYRGT
jgi:enoyl-CoA hydratase/carnithine racemase